MSESTSRYAIVDVTRAGRIGDEQMGSKDKFWWQDRHGTRWLFKFARANTGEHWSEKIAAEIGASLANPSADVELAQCEGSVGSVSRSFAQDGALTLVHGNELLQERDASYPMTQLRGVSKHTVAAVLSKLEPMLPPSDNEDLSSAADWFVGYLMLDALILNTDRHHENWGVLQLSGPSEQPRLAPSYDHASSLGRELVDREREERLRTADSRRTVEAYVLRARSGLYQDETSTAPLHPIEAFLLACEERPRAGKIWLARLDDLRDDTFRTITARIPTTVMSEPARTFSVSLLTIARRMILQRAGLSLK